VRLNRKLIIVSLLYFAEGFPYGIIEQAFPVYFRIHGMALEHVGLLSVVSLPYALKFLWAPAVDFIGKRRQWISSVQFLMSLFLCVSVSLDPSDPSLMLWACLAALAVLSATQDIAIDAYTIELLEPSEMGIANGFRQAAYRVALVVAGGLFVAMGGWIGWKVTYLVAAGVLGLCAVASSFLPAVEVQRPALPVESLVVSARGFRTKPGVALLTLFIRLYELLKSLVSPARDFLTRPGVVQVTLFILFYKLGDMAMGPMVRPFWLEQGLSTTEIGLITGSLGILSSIAGGLAGGLFMVRFSIYHGLWFLGLWQSVSNLTYVWVAASPDAGHMGIYIASAVESFCAGLGTSAFLAFLMSICNKQFSATQYAILSGIFRIAGSMAGILSGWLTGEMGYAAYFALTFLMSLPAFAFIPACRKWIPQEALCDSGSVLPTERQRIVRPPRVPSREGR
jgi:MFS transporter, PAT family, beta-lactamase induction signal transducer AmpG